MSEQQKTYGYVQLGVGDNAKILAILDRITLDGIDGRQVSINTLEDGTVFTRIANPITSERESVLNIPLTPDTFKLMMRGMVFYLAVNDINIADAEINHIDISDNLKSQFDIIIKQL